MYLTSSGISPWEVKVQQRVDLIRGWKHQRHLKSHWSLQPSPREQLWRTNQQAPGRFVEIIKRWNLFTPVTLTYGIKCAFSRLGSSASRHSNHIKWVLIIMAEKAGWLSQDRVQNEYRWVLEEPLHSQCYFQRQQLYTQHIKIINPPFN